MTDRATLLALAERVEAATGADRELGARVIAASLAPANAFVEQSKINGAWCIYTADADGKNRSWQPPRGVRGYDRCPTESLDAAMSLVPSGWDWSLNGEGNPKSYVAELWVYFGDGEAIAKAATPALALTAACLRARAIAWSMTDAN